MKHGTSRRRNVKGFGCFTFKCCTHYLSSKATHIDYHRRQTLIQMS